jgi:SAM-dependent methyltransferase
MRATTDWHDLECGAYAADLEEWERLSASRDGPVLDLGCGTGRVALHLARRGNEVVGIDKDPDLVSEMLARGAAEGLPVQGEVADVLDLDLGRRFSLALAPMQLIQLLDDAGERARLLAGVTAHLEADGLSAFAIVEEVPGAAGDSRPLPDVLEREGWVISSQPVSLDVSPEEIRLMRLRQAVSPAGELSEEHAETALARLSAEGLAREASAHGLVALDSVPVAPSTDHVGSTILTFGKRG